MYGISSLDVVVVLVYLIGITVLGTWAVKRVRSASSFFIGDRKYGKVLMMFFMFGTGTHSDQAVSVAAKSYHVGASGIWYQWLWLPVTPFFWLIAPVFRRMRAVTTADFFEARYGRGVSVLYALVGSLQLTISLGVMLKGASAMITALTGGRIDPIYAMWAMTGIFVIYGIAGGLNAAIMTDFVQGLLTIVLSFLILPFALSKVGGLQGLRETVSDPHVFAIVAPGEITVFYVTVIALNALIGWVTQPHHMAMCAAGRTEMEGRVGVMFGMLAKRICTIAWVLTGLCAIGLYGGQDVDADHIYGLMGRDLLPAVAPGLVGLLIASLLASVMSSCDAFMVTSSALFTHNFYKPVLSPGRPDGHYVFVGRVSAGFVVLAGILVAYELESVVAGLEVFWKIAAMMGIAFWAGVFWRRATPAAAWASTLVSFAVLLLTERVSLFGHILWDFAPQLEEHLPAFMLWSGKIYLPWQMISYLSAGLVTLVVVSLLTRPIPKEKLDSFHTCLRTPVAPDEPETAPFTLPPGTAPAPRNVWLNHDDFEIPRPSLVSILGFVAGWIAVILLVAGFAWILRAGT